MTLRTLSCGLAIIFMMGVSTMTPLAQTPAPADPETPAISMAEARRIAIDNGMVRIEEIELDDGIWELEGLDNADAEIEIDIRASDGVVVRVERDYPAFATAPPP